MAPPGDELGAAVLTLTSVPPDVGCLQVIAAGSRQVMKRFDLQVGGSPSLEMGGLPLGEVQFSSTAFAEACDGTTSTETWLSDPTPAVIAKGIVSHVVLTMRRNGRSAISIDFDDCAGAFVDLVHSRSVDQVEPTDMNDLGQVVGYVGRPEGTTAFLWQGGVSVTIGAASTVSDVEGINNRGQVVGNGAGGGFLWDSEQGILYDIGDLGGGMSWARAMNESGQVVGESLTSSGDTHAFTWRPGGAILDLGTLGGPTSAAVVVNSSGQVAGESRTASGENHPVLWEATGTAQDLGTLGGTWSTSVAINDAGQVAGVSSIANDQQTHAFLWTAGSMRDLGTLGGDWSSSSAINASGQVVGQSNLVPFGPQHAVLWDEGGIHDLGTFGGDSSGSGGFHRAISDEGEIVGAAETALGEMHAFYWKAGIMHDLGALGVPSTTAFGINRAHQIFGDTVTSSGRQRGFFLDPNGCSASASAAPTPTLVAP
jgi:probable HAF family extracellular repeat protein